MVNHLIILQVRIALKIIIDVDLDAEIMKKLSNEPGLKFNSEYIYSNGSVYKGQMKGEDRHGYGV